MKGLNWIIYIYDCSVAKSPRGRLSFFVLRSGWRGVGEKKQIALKRC